MNLITLAKRDFISPGRVRLQGRRREHIEQILQAKRGDQLSVGVLNGKLGTGCVISTTDGITLDIHCDISPPQALPLTLVIALPRPKVLRRLLKNVTSMGVKHIILCHSYRVEKSYWQSPLLKPSAMHEALISGLEQAKDTIIPHIEIKTRFKPFVEDELPNLCQDKTALVAHPGSKNTCPRAINSPCVLVTGPEGGFIDYEVDKLNQAGCHSIHIGERILTVETALTSLISKLY